MVTAERRLKNLFFLPALLIVVFVQTTVIDYFKVFGVKPDLLLGFVVVASVYLDWKWAFTLSLLAGLFKDLFGSTGTGINIFLLALWSYLLWKLSRKISIDDPVGLSAAAFASAVLNSIASRILYLSLGKYVSLGIFLRIMIIESFYTALVVFIFLSAIRRLPFKKTALTA